MADLWGSIQKIALENSETRRHLIPLLRKFAVDAELPEWPRPPKLRFKKPAKNLHLFSKKFSDPGELFDYFYTVPKPNPEQQDAIMAHFEAAEEKGKADALARSFSNRDPVLAIWTYMVLADRNWHDEASTVQYESDAYASIIKKDKMALAYLEWAEQNSPGIRKLQHKWWQD